MPDIEVKRRIWPFARPTHQLVLNRVEVQVVDVPLESDLVVNRVLSKAPLPECVFAIAMAFDRHAGGNKPVREIRLDPSPAAGEIGIA